MIKNASKFCGANMKKIKNIFSMRKVQAHNLRNEDEVELGNNINGKLTHLNNIFAFNDFDEIERTYYKCLKRCKKKPRKDHIKCLDYVFFRSDCFNNEIEEDLFRECALEFFQNYFGDCPYIVYEHNDEKVQHFHVMVIPFSKKEEKFIGSNFCGKRKDLIELQTLFAEYCMGCGLERGKSGSKDKHKDIGKYYEEEAQKLHDEWVEAIEQKEQEYKDAYNLVVENLNKVKSLDEEIQIKRHEADIENLQKYKESTITYYKELENTLKQDDGSEYFKGIRACFEYLKELLINMGVLHINKENNINR